MITIQKSLSTIFPAMRISFALVLLTACILLSAEMLGFTPQESKFLVESRAKISETLALQLSILIPDKDMKKIQTLIRYMVKRDPDILSAGIRLTSGNLIFQSADHSKLWDNYKEGESTSSHVLVPILQKGGLWANVELRFKEMKSESFLGFFSLPVFRMIAFICLVGFFVFLIFMLRTLRQLDPTAVIPERVNAAFNTLSEGVVILDEREQILLANNVFCDKIGILENSLLGLKASELNWKNVSDQNSDFESPWNKVLSNSKKIVGAQLFFEKSKNELIKFAINVTPILGENDKSQGVLITLDDISVLEKRNTELKTVVSRLQKTQFRVQQQNKELSFLATRDSLTGCLNRRAFTEQFDMLFNQAQKMDTELSCIMVDIDHFKVVNDTYGHGRGDEVIKLLADILKSNSRKDDLVARYGGEEFCLVFPGMTDDKTMDVAERIRLKVKSESASVFDSAPRITVSLGVSSFNNNPATPEVLNNLADKALYVAKETGRNKVIMWDEDAQAEVNESAVVNETGTSEEQHESVEQMQNRINQLEKMASNFSEQLEYQQSYDALTGLPNQVLFYDRIQQSIERGYRLHQLAAVLIIDIEMFSQINTTLGRDVGDQLLQEFAKRLNSIFRKSDGVSRLTVSRIAGDEFAVLLTDINHDEQVTWAIQRLLDAVESSVEIEGNTIHTSVKIGASLYPSDASTVDELLSHAMTAKKYIKNHQSSCSYQFYDQQMQKTSIKNLQLEKELRVAIKEKQWVLLYQPKLDIKTGKIIGAEALIRWQHPQRGLLSPFEFIDFAEMRNLIIPIGDWVIQQACQQIKDLLSQGLMDCTIAINLSSKQLLNDDVVQKVFTAIEQYEVPPRLLELEVTETALIDNISIAAESLKRLSSRGIKIAIDDFGTGYSSLNYLKNLPINSLKIDRSFVKDICDDSDDKQMVKTLIAMAHSLDLYVIAEGVEEIEQLDLLNGYGCDEMQGYLLSKPVTVDKLVELLNNPKAVKALISKK